MPKGRPVKVKEDSYAVAKELVSRIYADVLAESCVVFVGAGSTTERPGRARKQETYYEHIKEIAQYPGDRPSFPELMEYFCDKMDGGRHNRLIREALSRIEIFCARGEQNRSATAFTESLAEIPYFNRFVTTNWDPFLERSLDVLVAMVEDRDLAFWDDRNRQVLKIHGCITRPYSIVATQGDYDGCMSKNPLIFNKLKDLMATKTFIFTGYSMRDPDFKTVWDSMIGSLGHFARLAYALDPNVADDQVSFWRDRGIQIFKAMDVNFIRALRDHLERDGLIPSERFIEFLRNEYNRIVSTHLRMGQTSDGRLSSAMYQDGLLHGLDSILTSTSLGTKKKDDFESEHGDALREVQRVRRCDNPVEIAYWSGRAEVLDRFNRRRKLRIPSFFHPYELRPLQRLMKGSRFRSRGGVTA